MRNFAFIYGLVLFIALTNLSVSAGEESCIFCGMNRSLYGHSWVRIIYQGAEPEGYCSVHCAAIAMALHTDRLIDRITVGDFNTRKQIDAEKATWVIGGDLPGVMTARAKWAFESPEAADAFITGHGGKAADFQKVLEATFDDMLIDTLMIRKKRKLIDRRTDHTTR
jgi:copper chaperone NosL